MRPPSRRELALTAVAAAAWGARLAADHRAIRADPAKETLDAPLDGGRPLAVVASDGTPLRVLEFGSRDAPVTVVLVHGWTCTLRVWTCQIQALSPDHHVIAYDLRGHGSSGRPGDNDYSIDAHARDLDAVLHQAVPAGRRAVVAGHSLGAMTLVAWASHHHDDVRDRIAGAALVNTGVADLIDSSAVLPLPARLAGARRIAGRAMLGAAIPLPKGPTPLSYRVVRHVALSDSASPAQIAFCERIILACKTDVRAACGGTIGTLDLQDGIASLCVPTVLIGGEHDKLTPPAHVRALAAVLPRVVEQIIIPGAGHMGPVSDPDVVTEQIRALGRDHARDPAAAAA